MDGLHDRIIEGTDPNDPLYMLKVSKGNKYIDDKPKNEVKYAYNTIEEKERTEQNLGYYL